MKKAMFALLLLNCLGCAQIMGALRRDLDDGGADTYADAPPTTGGRWAERGFLAESSPDGGAFADQSVGHNDRRPSSDSNGSRDGESGWDQGRSMGGSSSSDEDPNGSSTVSRVDPNIKRQYKNGGRATRADFVDEAQNEGSLWASDGQTNYYLTKNKVRGLGDIIQLTAEADLVRDIGLEARRSLTPMERNYELFAAQERIRMRTLGIPDPAAPKNKDSVATSAAAPAPAPATKDKDGKEVAKAEEPEIPQATPADVDVGKSLEVKATDVFMGEIIERYPNGNYKIRATKKVPYKGGAPRMVTVTGVVKGTDISEEDMVGSGKLYEYRVDVAR